MNKEIFKQLALQAGGSHYPAVAGELMEKFAELLVNECIAVVRQTPTSAAFTDRDLMKVKRTIDLSVQELKRKFDV